MNVLIYAFENTYKQLLISKMGIIYILMTQYTTQQL